MNRYLITYDDDQLFTCLADDSNHATEQFRDWAEADAVIKSMFLCAEVVARDEVIFRGVEDVKFDTIPGDRKWVQMGGIAVYLGHNDEGVSVDLFHHGQEDGESEAGTWLEFAK